MTRSILRIAIVALSVETLMAASIYVRGFPSSEGLFGAPTAWEEPISLVHGPAILTLAGVGLCCGYYNGIVLGDEYFEGHIPMTLLGTVMLGVTNVLVWVVLSTGVLWLWRKRRTRHAV